MLCWPTCIVCELLRGGLMHISCYINIRLFLDAEINICNRMSHVAVCWKRSSVLVSEYSREKRATDSPIITRKWSAIAALQSPLSKWWCCVKLTLAVGCWNGPPLKIIPLNKTKGGWWNKAKRCKKKNLGLVLISCLNLNVFCSVFVSCSQGLRSLRSFWKERTFFNQNIFKTLKNPKTKQKKQPPCNPGAFRGCTDSRASD